MSDLALTTGLLVYISVLSFVIGSVFGSFINCLAWRVVHKESVLKGRSHCAVCGHTLSTLDLVPVFSYLFLRGRCRYCKEKISPRYMLTELLLGILFVVAFLRFGLTFETVRVMVLAVILLGLSLVDLDSYEIPNGFILAGMIWWAISCFLIGQPIKNQMISGVLGGLVIAGALLIISLIFDRVTGRESIGGGDIKLFFMVGLYLGPVLGLFNLIFSCLVGLVFSIARRSGRIPFGPAIAIASYFSLLFGNALVEAYLNLLMI